MSLARRIQFQVAALRGRLQASAPVRSCLRHYRRYAKPCCRRSRLLVGRTDIKELWFGYGRLLPRLAEQLGSRLVSFDFRSTLWNPLQAAFFQAMGARPELFPSTHQEVIAKADQRARELARSFSNKEDLAKVTEEGVWIGDLVYDTILRDLLIPTIDIDDARIIPYLREALVFLYSSQNYFDHHEIAGVVVDHTVYTWQGVVQRVALKRNIPVYMVYYAPNPAIQRVDIVPKLEQLATTIQHNHWLFPKAFARLPATEQVECIRKGHEFLKHRLSGGVQNGVLPGQSAYGTISPKRELSNSSAPKILVLLHDFCDAVHGYRSLLFPDFYEWIHFLLAEASETPFEWYIKPHPNLNDYRRQGLHSANDKVLRELRDMYPLVKLLLPTVSNRQLIAEGIASVFTMYGTSGHEMPYLGIPVVNCADNPHAAYSFAITPWSVDEYRLLIQRADRLDAFLDKEEIAEFCYMQYMYLAERLSAKTQVFRPAPSPGQTINELADRALLTCDRNTDRTLDVYIKQFLEGKIPPCVI